MAKVGAQRAAVLTGRSKSTIQRAMNAGKLSFEQDANGRRLVDVSELERVFGIKPTKQAPPVATISVPVMAASPNIDDVAIAVERERMSMTIKMLEQQLSSTTELLDDIKAQRDKWERQATQVLLTSQYTQKQAEELRNQLREREEKAKLRRLQYEERFAQIEGNDRKGSLLGNTAMGKDVPARDPWPDHTAKKQASAPSSQAQPRVTNKSREAEKLDEQMKKLKAENENAKATNSSVFRFWKRVTG